MTTPYKQPQLDTLNQMFGNYAKIWKDERRATQLTIGELLKQLKRLPPSFRIKKLHSPHSYRGYYEDLAFELDENSTIMVNDLIAIIEGEVLGKIFIGYKGGDFLMDESCPVWISEYGCTGVKLVEIMQDGTFITKEDT